MEWVTNATKEVRIDNVMRESVTGPDGEVITETAVEALAREKAFRAKLIMGPPKATERYTVDELRAQGMIGLYQS